MAFKFAGVFAGREAYACLLALGVFLYVGAVVVVDSVCAQSYGRVFCRCCQSGVDFGKTLALGHGVKYNLVVLEVGGFHNHFHSVGEGVFGGVPFG